MRSFLLHALVALFALASLARAAGEQGEPEFVVLEFRATAVAGTSVYIDLGRDDGLEPNDRVRIFRPGGPVATGEVRSVSSKTARVELFQGQPVDVGFRGEVRVPVDRLERLRAAAEPGEAQAVEHPPWTHPPVEWDTEQPLLAPVAAREPQDREADLKGRAFLQVEPTWDHERDAQTLFGRLGTDLRLENPFARGGRLLFEGDVAVRAQDLPGGDDETDRRARVRRLSYAWGGTRYEPMRVEAGRFFQRSMPEFGLLDGVELAGYRDTYRYFGVSGGYFVEPDFELTTGEDQQLAAFAAGEARGPGGVGWRVGYQKTWHEGRADRDLFAGGLNWQGEGGLSLVGSAMLDLYTSNELVRDAGLELTELHLDGGWRGESLGLTAGVHRFRLPDLRRAPVPTLPGEDPIEPRSDSAYVRLRGDVSRHVRLSARVDTWQTATDEGNGGELRGDLRDVLYAGGGLSATLYRTDGQLVDVDGLRLALDKDTSVGSWWAGYELSRTTFDDAQGPAERQTRHSLRLSWDRTLGRDWSFSLYGEDHFGDEQDALTLGFYLQRRF